MNKIKKIVCVLLFILICFCCSCKYEPNNITMAILNENLREEQIHQYDSPYTVCFKNKNNTFSFYIFSSPIQFKTKVGYSFYDTSIINVKNSKYAFSNKASDTIVLFPLNIKDGIYITRGNEFLKITPQYNTTFLSGKKTTITNQYNDKINVVIYGSPELDLAFYPTSSGIGSQFIIKQKLKDNKLSFKIETSGTFMNNFNNGYITFHDGQNTTAIIHSPIIVDSQKTNQKISMSSSIETKGNEKFTTVCFQLDDKLLLSENTVFPILIDPSFQLYNQKIPDSSVYSKWDKNSFQQRFAILGTHSELGTGEEYLRFRIQHFIDCNPKTILQATFHTKMLLPQKNSSLSLSLYKMNTQWSSTATTWTTRKNSDKKIASQTSFDSGYASFDITKYVQYCFYDDTKLTESYGLLMKNDLNSGWSMLATSDNGTYIPYVKLILSSLPDNFRDIGINDMGSLKEDSS